MRGLAKFALDCLTKGQKRRQRRSFKAAEVLESRTLLTAFVVTSLADSGVGTLRQALLNSSTDANADADTITFQSGLSGTISVESRLIISSDVSIIGPGSDVITIDGTVRQDLVVNPNTPWRTMLQVEEDVTAVIEDVTITHVNDEFGGEIGNIGDLTLRDVVLDGLHVGPRNLEYNTIRNYESGTMRIESSSIINMGGNPLELVRQSRSSIGISNEGRLIIQESTFSQERDQYTDSFMLIENRGGVLIEDSTFTTTGTGNTTGGFTDVHNEGLLAIGNSQFSGNNSKAITNVYQNWSFESNGGAPGLVLIEGSTFENYHTAVSNSLGGDLGISASTFDSNYYGIYTSGSAVVELSLFTDNTVGISSESASQRSTFVPFLTKITNSTFSGNESGIQGMGHGSDSLIKATNVTVTNNQTGIKFTEQFQSNRNVTVHLDNSIVVGNDQEFYLTPSSMVVARHSLIGDASTAGGVVNGTNGNIVGALATDVLHPLANNGGVTLTHALKPTSIAVNSGNNSLSLDFDGAPLIEEQRGEGFARIKNGTVDMGAYEIELTNIDIAAFNPASGQWTIGRSDGDNFIETRGPKWSTAVTWDTFTGDVNGDGLTDLLGRQHETGQWWVGVNNGTGFDNQYFGKWATQASLGWQSVRVGDFNGDGMTDVIGQDQRGMWWAGLSSGTRFQQDYMGRWSPTGWQSIMVGDINGDGNDDLIGFAEASGQWWAGLSTGDAFDTRSIGRFSPTYDWRNFNTGDFNGDGKQDVIAQTKFGHWYYGTLNNSNRLDLTYAGASTLETAHGAPRIGDFNGDGRDDLLVIGSSRDVYVKLATGTGMTATIHWGKSPENRTLLGSGDVDGNGADDLIFFNPNNAQWINLLSTRTKFTSNFFGTGTFSVNSLNRYFTGEFVE